MNEVTFKIHRRTVNVTVEYDKNEQYPTVRWDGGAYKFNSSAFSLVDMENYYIDHASTLGLRYEGVIATSRLMECIANDLQNCWEGVEYA